MLQHLSLVDVIKNNPEFSRVLWFVLKILVLSEQLSKTQRDVFLSHMTKKRHKNFTVTKLEPQ